ESPDNAPETPSHRAAAYTMRDFHIQCCVGSTNGALRCRTRLRSRIRPGLRPFFAQHFSAFIILCLTTPVCVPTAAAQTSSSPVAFPYRQPPVEYFDDDLRDPVSRLKERTDRGAAHLEFEAGTGYLRSLLRALDVPVE